MAGKGEIIFSRGEIDDSEIWDDTALIQAYDDSIQTIRHVVQTKVSSQGGDNNNDKLRGANNNMQRGSGDSGIPQCSSNRDLPQQNYSAKTRKERKKRGEEKVVNNDKIEYRWSVNDRCRAIYSEDGLTYPALIKKIDNAVGTCVVEYDGYGNQEQQLLVDLFPPGVHSVDQTDNWSRQAEVRISESLSDSDHCDKMKHLTSHVGPPNVSNDKHRNDSQSEQRSVRQSDKRHEQKAGRQCYKGEGTGRGKASHRRRNSRPNYFRFLPSGSAFIKPPSFMHGGVPPAMPFMPPMPPPPPLDDDDFEVIKDDQEALYSMLISWYMSGYHTGYYQGLKQGKQHSKGEKTNSTSEDERFEGLV